VKFALDGGESNPEQVADDLFTFWNFSPEEQEKRSVSNTLVSSWYVFVATSKSSGMQLWCCNHCIYSGVAATFEI